MSLQEILSEKEKIIEVELTKDIKEGDQLSIIGRKIYLQPLFERTYNGFILSGAPINNVLPYFSIELDFQKKKVIARIKGDSIPSEFRESIESILYEHF